MLSAFKNLLIVKRYRAEIVFTILFYSNYFVSAVTSLAVSRILGPTDRGLFAKYLLFYFAFELAADKGLHGATQHMCAKEKSFANNLRRPLLGQLVRNSIGFISVIFILNLQLKLIPSSVLLTLWVAQFIVMILTVDLPILQGVDVNRWSRINLIQPLFYAILIIFFNIFQLSASSAVLAITLSYVPQGLVARIALKRYLSQEVKKQYKLPEELRNYANKNLIWTVTSTIFSRIDVFAIAFLYENYFLGMYSTAAGFILLCSPILNAFSTRKFFELSQKSRISKQDFEREFLLSIFITFIVASLLIIFGKYALITALGESFREINKFLIPAAIIVIGKLTSYSLAQFSRASGEPLYAAKWEFASIVLILLLTTICRIMLQNPNLLVVIIIGMVIWIVNCLQYKHVLKGFSRL